MSDLIKDTASVNNPYGDIDKLMENQKSLLEQQQIKQNEILNQQTQMQIDQINRNKAELDKETAKTNSGLYAEYKKASNPYGANAEQLFTQGLGNSGYAESTQTSLYNTYQKNITDTINTSNKLKADFDFQIQQAMQNRDVQQAQYALEMYKQNMNLLTQEYDLKNNKEQDLYNRGIDERNYNYQVGRDQVADSQWEKEYQQMLKENELAEQWRQKNYDYQVGRDQVADNQWQQQYDYQVGRDQVADNQWQQQYDYQVNRDAVEDSQWQKEYDYQVARDKVADSQWERQFALSQAKSSGGSGGSSRSSGGSSSSYGVNLGGGEAQQQGASPQTELSENAKNLYSAYTIMKNNPITKNVTNLDKTISTALNQGKISENDALLLLERYG